MKIKLFEDFSKKQEFNKGDIVYSIFDNLDYKEIKPNVGYKIFGIELITTKNGLSTSTYYNKYNV